MNLPSAMPIRHWFYPAATALLLPITASAAEANTAASDIGGGILQLVFGFVLIFALLFATLWVLKKISVPRGAGASQIRVVTAAAVGPRERVVIVDVADKRLVLGVAPGHVSLLTEQVLPEGSSATTLSEASATTPAFAQWLQRTLAKRNEK